MADRDSGSPVPTTQRSGAPGQGVSIFRLTLRCSCWNTVTSSRTRKATTWNCASFATRTSARLTSSCCVTGVRSSSSSARAASGALPLRVGTSGSGPTFLGSIRYTPRRQGPWQRRSQHPRSAVLNLLSRAGVAIAAATDGMAIAGGIARGLGLRLHPKHRGGVETREIAFEGDRGGAFPRTAKRRHCLHGSPWAVSGKGTLVDADHVATIYRVRYRDGTSVHTSAKRSSSHPPSINVRYSLIGCSTLRGRSCLRAVA